MNFLIPYKYLPGHEDPVFDEFTYGDKETRAKKLKRDVCRGDHLFFHKGIGGKKYITAYYIVERILDTKEAAQDKNIVGKSNSPHIKGFFEGTLKDIENDVMVFGDPLKSKILLKPLALDRGLAEKLALNVKFPKGRTENQAIVSATRAWRQLTPQDVKILIKEIDMLGNKDIAGKSKIALEDKADVEALEDKFLDEEETDSEQQEYTIPVAERKIITQPSEPTISRICEMIERGKLEVRADFQREYVWENKANIKSRLIESVLLGVPIPEIYIAEETGKDLVIDGQQRLLTFYGFKNNKFRLKGLTILQELNGYTYKELSNKDDPKIKEVVSRLGDLQDKFLDRPIGVTKVLQESHPDIKFEIFERLNRGSVKLNDQELRNCIYRGIFNDLLKELVNNKDFLRLQGLKKSHNRMLDRERVLRFFAFCDRGERNYKSPLKKFLNEYMESKREISKQELEGKSALFKKCVELCQTVFGNVAYKRVFKGNEDDPNGYIDTGLNQGVFDVQMCGFMEYDKRDIIPRAEAIKEAFLELVATDVKFIETVEIGTYGTNQVKTRMEMWISALRSIVKLPSDDRRLFTYEEKKRLFDANNACAICKNKITYIEDASVDHIERYKDGGKTTMRNGRLTHRYCNFQRH